MHGSTFVSLIMTCEVATSEGTVKSALGSVGLRHLDWLLLLCALGLFVGLTVMAVPEDRERVALRRVTRGRVVKNLLDAPKNGAARLVCLLDCAE